MGKKKQHQKMGSDTLLPKGDPLLLLAFCLFIATFLLGLWAMSRHLDNPLFGPHSFRQTQTAVSAYYMSEDAGIFLDYTTPILGKPWRIPLEVPFFQWITARFYNISGFGLDASGKTISVVFWILCTLPVGFLLKTLKFDSAQVMISLSIMLSSPLYLFWANAFLMETMATFLSLCMVAFLVRAAETRNTSNLIWAALFGLFCILCKGTTWAVASGFSVLFLCLRSLKGYLRSKESSVNHPIKIPTGIKDVGMWFALMCVFILPFVAGKLWISYGDRIKSENPFAREVLITSSSQGSAWYYGTLAQKLDISTWIQIWRHIADQLLVPVPFLGHFLLPLILLVGMASSPKRIPLVLILLAAFTSGPLIFTNLYFEHSYYWCANGIYLLLAVGIALSGIWEYNSQNPWGQITSLVLASMTALAGFLTWQEKYLPILNALPTQEQVKLVWKAPVQNVVPRERTLLIVGNGWNPNSLYYAERKGIAFPFSGVDVDIQFPGNELEESLKQLLPNEKLGAVVIAESMLAEDKDKNIPAILNSLGISSTGVRTPFGVLFPAFDLIKK